MPRAKVSNTPSSGRQRRPAIDPEIREKQLTALAVDLAEQQLRDGTASSQVITHFLKLATRKEEIEREILELQKDLVAAKTESIRAQQRSDEMFKEAINAIRGYQGHGDPDDR